MSSTIYHSTLEFAHNPRINPQVIYQKAIKIIKKGLINGKRILLVNETQVEKGEIVPYFGYQKYSSKKGKKALRHGVWQFWGVILLIDGDWDRDVYGIYEVCRGCRLDICGAVSRDVDKDRIELKRIG